jgi:hypothetical protein
MKRKNADDLFSDLLRNDRVGEPANEVEDRLMYSYMLKSGKSKVRQNSFASFFGWMLSGRGVAFKAAVVSLVVYFSVYTNPGFFEAGKLSAGDSLSYQRTLVADSAHFNQLIDSLRVDSLNGF